MFTSSISDGHVGSVSQDDAEAVRLTAGSGYVKTADQHKAKKEFVMIAQSLTVKRIFNLLFFMHFIFISYGYRERFL